MPFDATTVLSILVPVGSVLGGAAAWVYYRSREAHTSTVDEYKGLLKDQRQDDDERYDKLKADYANLWQQMKDAEMRCDRELAQLRTELATQRVQAEAEYRKLADRLVRIQVQNQGLRGELQSARAELAAARSGQNPIFSPGFWAFCIIVTNDHGVIREANPGLLLLFHWSQEEVVNQNVKMLIPPRFHAAHDRGMAAVRERPGVSQSGRVLSLWGLTRSGEEIPIDIQLESWQEGGKTFCGASIKRRWLGVTDAGLLSNPEMPAFDPGPDPGALPAPPPAVAAPAPGAAPPPAPAPPRPPP